jgi:hypothetical protein
VPSAHRFQFVFLFYRREHSTTSDLFQVSAHSGKHRFTSPFHSRMVGHAKAIWHGSSMHSLPSHSLAGFMPKRAKWRCSRLENGDHRSKHRFFSRRCQRKLQHRTSQRQFLSPRPEPFWRIWWRQLSLAWTCIIGRSRWRWDSNNQPKVETRVLHTIFRRQSPLPANIIDCPGKHRSAVKTEHRLEASAMPLYAVAWPLRVLGNSSRDGSGRSLDTPESQCSTSFQPVFRSHHRMAFFQVAIVLPRCVLAGLVIDVGDRLRLPKRKDCEIQPLARNRKGTWKSCRLCGKAIGMGCVTYPSDYQILR